MQIACSHCGARYQFEASLIPPQGYDARCTSCQQVFFVHPQGAAKKEPSKEAPEPPIAEAPMAPQALHRGTMELGQAPLGPKKTAFDMGQELDLGHHFEGRAPMGNKRAHRGHAIDEDALPLARPWARRGLFLGVALVAVIGLGVAVGVFCSKRLHAPPQVQPPIHIVRAPDPIAAEAFARGIEALWLDTPDGYVTAAKAFDAACARDAEYTDAWAGAALAAMLRGVDLEGEARDALDVAQRRARQVLSEAAAENRPEDADAPSGDDEDDAPRARAIAQTLRHKERAQEALSEPFARAKAQLEQAVAMQRRGATLVLHTSVRTSQTPLMALAVAMFYTLEPQARGQAIEALRAFHQLAGGEAPASGPSGDVAQPHAVQPEGTVAPPSPVLDPTYMPLAKWVAAKIDAQGGERSEAQVVAAYEAALTLQPNLRRARFELATYELEHGHPAVARPLLEDLAHSQPAHAKARRVLNALASAPGVP